MVHTDLTLNFQVSRSLLKHSHGSCLSSRAERLCLYARYTLQYVRSALASTAASTSRPLAPRSTCYSFPDTSESIRSKSEETVSPTLLRTVEAG